MFKIIKNIYLLIAISTLSLSSLQATSKDERKKAQMIQELEIIKHHFEVGYAPAEWKKEYAAWDIDEAFERAKKAILTTPSITTKQFHLIIKHFFASMNDYHVGVLFFSTEKADLPFDVKGSGGRYFISWIDPIRLSSTVHGLRVGDELIEFDGRPIAEVIEELIPEEKTSSNPLSERALAAMKLCLRSGMTGDVVPKGSVFVTTRSAKSGKISTLQLIWNYTPEKIYNPLNFIDSLFTNFSWPSLGKNKDQKKIWPHLVMANPLHEALANEYTTRGGALGSRRSFLPPFGKILWQNDESAEDSQEESSLTREEKEDLAFWHAYIYQHPDGFNVGYIRIPHYMLWSGQLNTFGMLIDLMEKHTEALVIDQVDNYGGRVQAQYQLCSMMTDKPLHAPYHRIKITTQDIYQAHESLEQIQRLELAIHMAEEKNAGADGQEEENDDFNFQQILLLKEYYNNIIAEWNAGNTLTRPIPIEGVDRINPHPKYRYSKPILMLINEMDFSGGDFMPAIHQDNNRARLFGAKTAGAGGFVTSFEFPNANGIAKCNYTGSVAQRINDQKIENLGVEPDISYEITPEDISDGYKGYIEAANKAVLDLIGS